MNVGPYKLLLLMALFSTCIRGQQCYQFTSVAGSGFGPAATLTVSISSLPPPLMQSDGVAYNLLLPGNVATVMDASGTHTLSGLSEFFIAISSQEFELYISGSQGGVEIILAGAAFSPPYALPAQLPPLSLYSETAFNGSYTDFDTPVASITNNCGVPSCSSILNGGISPPSLSGSLVGDPTQILGSFTPNSGYTLTEAASLCGFTKFDWQQTVMHLPDPSPYCENNTDVTRPNPNPYCGINFSPPFPIHLTSLSAPFNDPPPNGYTYGFFHDSFPFYYPQATLENVCAESGVFSCSVPVVNSAGTTLSFFDAPSDPCISGPLGLPSTGYLVDPRKCGYNVSAQGEFIAFTTHLAGVQSDGSAFDLGLGYTWKSNFNGLNGGIATTASTGPVDPGTGTGGIQVINVSNTTLYSYPTASTTPTLRLLTGADVAITASGLAYSRVNQTFVGTLNIRSTSESAIMGPIQIVFNSLPSDVSLNNATGQFAGFPFLTLQDVGSLAPGQSVSINIAFKNASNVKINFLPVAYAGSFN